MACAEITSPPLVGDVFPPRGLLRNARVGDQGAGLSALCALCIVFNLLSHGGKPDFLIRQR